MRTHSVLVEVRVSVTECVHACVRFKAMSYIFTDLRAPKRAILACHDIKLQPSYNTLHLHQKLQNLSG